MSRRDRNLAGFKAVASKETDNNTNQNSSDNNDNDINKDSNNNIDNKSNNDGDTVLKNNDHVNVIDMVLKEKNKEKKMVQTGIYLEEDISNILNDLSKGKGRGGLKSKIINEALRQLFKEKGLLK